MDTIINMWNSFCEERFHSFTAKDPLIQSPLGTDGDVQKHELLAGGVKKSSLGIPNTCLKKASSSTGRNARHVSSHWTWNTRQSALFL